MRERYSAIITPAQVEQQPDLFEPTLGESLGVKKVPQKQKQAIRLLDEMNISLEHKRDLFFYYLWQESGSFAPIKEYGDIREDPKIDSLLDKVMESDTLTNEYELFYKNYEEANAISLQELMRRGNYFRDAVSELGFDTQVLELKQQKIKHEEIAKRLGIKKTYVDRISKELIAHGLIEPSPLGRAQAERFSKFLDKVAGVDDPKISDREIAETLGVLVFKVEKARKRLRLQNRIKKRTPKDVAQSQRKSRKLLPLREKIRKLDSQKGKIYTEWEIARLTGATMQQVKHQRAIIRKESKQ